MTCSMRGLALGKCSRDMMNNIFLLCKDTLHNLSSKQPTLAMPPVRHRHRLTDIEKGEIIVLSKNISHG